MADTPHQSGEHGAADGGAMDISGHIQTWLSFWAATKWSVVGITVILILLAIFRTHN